MPTDAPQTVALAHRILGPCDGPPLLLLHGLTGEGADWGPVADSLARDWRVYIVDLRGHGASPRALNYSFELMRDDVLALLDSLGLRHVTIIGHSLGAVLAYLAALAEPEAVRILVLEEPRRRSRSPDRFRKPPTPRAPTTGARSARSSGRSTHRTPGSSRACAESRCPPS